MKIDIKINEVFVPTSYHNFEIKFKGNEYKICVDFSEGIHDIEIAQFGDEYESLFDNDNQYIKNKKDRDEIIKAIEENLFCDGYEDVICFA